MKKPIEDLEIGDALTSLEAVDGDPNELHEPDLTSETAECVEELVREREEFRDLLLRKQAEFENYRKRTEKERSDVTRSAHAEVISQLLPIIDACEKGLDSLRAAHAEVDRRTYLEGYELLLKQMQGILERYNVTEVPGIGSSFDPNFHEAVLREVTDNHAENEVLEEYRKGYLIGERLLRPSQVKVAVAPEEG